MSQRRAPASVPPAGARGPAPRSSGSGPRRIDVTGPTRRVRVLLVDDDVDSRELFAWCMRAAGWTVEVASNGEQALLNAVGGDPDVIVLDVCMPVLDGWQTLTLLRQSATLSFVPVVLCTSLGGPEVEARARDAGCAAFVAKPCRPDELRMVIEGVIPSRAAGDP